jgi:hypothetical protein
MPITEPMTLATDYLLAVVTFVLGVRLFRESPGGRPVAVRLWGWTFQWLTVAALVGGTYHGATRLLPPLASSVLWKITIYSIGLADACVVAAIVRAYLPRRAQKMILVLIGLKVAFFLVWTWRHDAFKYVIYDYVPSLLFVLVLSLVTLARTRSAGAAWIAGGICVSFVAAAIQLGGRGLHRHFNHNDLYHDVQLVAMGLLYRGGRNLRDRHDGERA